MRTKIMVSAIAIALAGALAASVGSASAAEQVTSLEGQFTTLEGIPAEAMSAHEMSDVVGTGIVQDALLKQAGLPAGNSLVAFLKPNTDLFGKWFGMAGGVFF